MDTTNNNEKFTPKGIYNFDCEIDFDEKTITIGDICSSGGTYDFDNPEEIIDAIKFYIETYIFDNNAQ